MHYTRRGHSGLVEALCVLPDGRLASGSWDNTIRLWDPNSGAEHKVQFLAVQARLLWRRCGSSLPFWTEHKSLTSAACSGRFGGDSATGTTASPTVDPMLDTPRAGGKMRSMDPR
jgi:WD40 repeat protein